MSDLEMLHKKLDLIIEVAERKNRRIAALEGALREIDGEAPTSEPRKYSITGAPFNWDAETRELIEDIADEAFNQGRARGLWEASAIAARALRGEA